MENKINIQICMGSSCFARGNKETLEIIKKYLDGKNVDISTKLKGILCHDLCSKGPNIIVNDKVYSGVTKQNVIDILVLSSILCKFIQYRQIVST